MDDEMTPGDYRAEIARLGVPKYVIAAQLPVHPTRFSRWLWGREPMPSSAKQRLAHVLKEEWVRLRGAHS